MGNIRKMGSMRNMKNINLEDIKKIWSMEIWKIDEKILYQENWKYGEFRKCEIENTYGKFGKCERR